MATFIGKARKAFAAGLASGVAVFAALGGFGDPVRYAAAAGAGVVIGIITYWTGNEAGG